MMVRQQVPTTTKLDPSGPSKVAVVCPSVCSSDRDKRKTLAAIDCTPDSCGERQKKKRRGQDSNLRRTVKSSPV